MLSRVRVLLVLTIVLGLMLVACGGDDRDDDDLAESVSGAQDAASEVSEPDAGRDEPAVDADDVNAGASQISADSWDRKVIRSAELDLVVEDVSRASRQARDLVADHGGYLSSSSARTLSEDDERAELDFQVPADAFEPVMNELRDSRYVVRVEHEATSSQDVTEEFVDLGSRLGNLESTEARFVELLEEATSISEIMDVENEISRIRGEIEQIQGRLNYLEQRTDYSRIYVSMIEDEEDATVAGPGFTPGETAREAWNASLEFVGTVANAAITLVVFFWWVWPVIGVVVLGFSRYRRRSQLEQRAA